MLKVAKVIDFESRKVNKAGIQIVFRVFLLCPGHQPFTTQSQLSTTLKKKPFENIMGEGENTDDQHFLLFLQCLLPIPRRISFFNLLLFCCLQILSIWTSLKLSFGKELNHGIHSIVQIKARVNTILYCLSYTGNFYLVLICKKMVYPLKRSMPSGQFNFFQL